jgi:RNA polymerase sigma-70 factor (ECF subfamily)
MSEEARPESDPSTGITTKGSTELLNRAQGGNPEALETLFARHAPPLKRWAHGRLPRWARGALETADLVQEVMVNAFRRLRGFESRRQGALQAYLRQAIQNRIRDELRAFGRRPTQEPIDSGFADPAQSPLSAAIDAETRERYLAALARLREGDRELIVGSIELGYTYEQLAAATGRTTADSARVAVRRALLRLADEMRGG